MNTSQRQRRTRRVAGGQVGKDRRGLRRRRAIAAKKGRLCVDDAYRLDRQRRLPDDHLWDVEEPVYTGEGLARSFLSIIRKSGVVYYLDQRFRSHPGRKSKVSMEDLLLFYFLSAYKHKSVRRTDLCAVANGIDSQVAYSLGHCDHRKREPFSYQVIRKQQTMFEMGLRRPWIAPDGTTVDFPWLIGRLLAASIPNKYLKLIKAAAIDSTADRTWARNQARKKGADTLAEHRLEALEEPDLPEPSLPTIIDMPIVGKTIIGTLGPDGRPIYSLDGHARVGYKSGTSTEPPSLFLGYDVHYATGVATASWKGDIDKLVLKSIPGFILAMHVAPAATNPGPIGLDLIKAALQIAPRLREALADRAYTTKRQKFNRKLHIQGMDLVMDYTKNEINKPKLIEAGRNHRQFILLDGSLYLESHLPENLRVPPENASPEKLEDFYVARSRWRWIRTQRLADGGGQFRCSQCHGLSTTNAKTYNPRNPNPNPDRNILFIGNIDTEYCCDGMVSIKGEDLDTFQVIPFGTPAWKKSYGRRNTSENTSENTFSQTKDKGGLQHGWCRAFGLAAHTLGALAIAIAHNLRVAQRCLRVTKKTNRTHRPLEPTSDPATLDEPLTGIPSPRAPP